MAKDLRSFLLDLVRTEPDALKRVDTEVDPRFGITAYGALATKANRHSAFLFTKVVGSELPCVTNLLTTPERMAVALGCSVADVRTGAVYLNGRHQFGPVEVDRADAPVKQVMWRGEDVDLTRLPIPVHNELDGGPFLTAAVTVLRDPESGHLNAGIYRHHVYDARHLGIWFFGSHHGGTIHRRYAARNEPTPFAIAIGHHPGFLMGAVSRVPGIGGEYEAAGAMLQEPLEVVRAETSDLLVPARAEIVLEGVILPDEQREEGPFAEWPGHYVAGGEKPVMRVDLITMRSDAIFQDIQSSGQEHRLMGALPRIASVYKNVQAAIPGLLAVNIPVYARMHCYLSIRKEQDNDPVRAAFAALNTEPENLRMVVVVDDDIDIFDEREMAWAIGTRMDAVDDLRIIPRWNGPGGLLPTNWRYDEDGSRTPLMSSATILDATKPAPPVKFPAHARVPQEALDQADLAATDDIRESADLPWEAERRSRAQ